MTTNAVDFFFQTMSRYEVLDHDELVALSAKVRTWQDHELGPDGCSELIQRHGRAARDRMVRHNLRLVVRIWQDCYSSRKLHSKHPGLADALQNAAKGLIRACEKFDPSTGYKFSTYATTWIHKGFRDYLSQEERMVRIPSHNFHIVARACAIQTLRTSQGLPEHSMEELAEVIGKDRKAKPSPEVLKQWMTAYATTMPRSFSEVVGEDTTLEDMVASSVTSSVDEDLDIESKAKEAMGYLTELERNVLKQR